MGEVLPDVPGWTGEKSLQQRGKKKKQKTSSCFKVTAHSAR